MTDHTIPADKVRELIDYLREEAAELENEEWGNLIVAERAAELRDTADRLEALLPAPSIGPATCAPDRLYRVEHYVSGREYLGWRLAPEDSEYPWMISGGWWCRDHHLTVLGEVAPLHPTDAQNLADLTEIDRIALLRKDVLVDEWESPAMLVGLSDREGAVLGQNTFAKWPQVHIFPLTELTPLDPTDVQDLADMPVDAPDTTHIPAGEAWIVEIDGEQYHAIPDRSGVWHYIDDEGDHAEDWRAVPLHRLVEQQQPRTVSTEAEYAALPEGSVVAGKSEASITKSDDDSWVVGSWNFLDEEMSTRSRRVLRHGWGDEEAQA